MFLRSASSSCCVRNSPIGIFRAFVSFLLSINLWISGRDMWPSLSLSDGLHVICAYSTLSRGGSIYCVRMRREWPDLGGQHCHTQRSPSRGDPYLSSLVLGSYRITERAIITPPAAEENIDRWYMYMYCHGHSQVSSLAVCPLSLSLPIMTSGRPNRKCIAAV